MTPTVLARVRHVPTRAGAALLTFGGMLGVPAILSMLAMGAFAMEIEALGAILFLLAALVFFGTVVLAWIFIFTARTKLKRAQDAIYAGDFETATKDALSVVKTTFRADYQMGALFVLALAAERSAAFVEAGALFVRAYEMIPAMAAQGPGRRARALMMAHAAIDFAAAGDVARANQMLLGCHQQLGSNAQGGFDFLLDDSSFGAIGVNSLLKEMENRRDPRPLAVLAQMLIGLRMGAFQQIVDLATHERPSIERGLAPNEQALAERIQSEAIRALSGGGAHRSPGALSAPTHASSWADAIVPVR